MPTELIEKDDSSLTQPIPEKRRANLESGRSLMHLASRIFNAPLAIWQKKGDVILHLLGPRLGVTELPSVDASMLLVEEQARRGSVADRFDDNSGNDDKPYSVTKDGIAVCEISGTLVRKATGLDALSGLASYETIQAELVGALTDANVKGILLCMDSPGGEVGGLFDLVDKLYSLKGSKPIYGAVCEMACSAMYAIASVCDKIFVSQTAAVGSIGVYALHVDQSEFDKNIGVKYTYVYAGAHKIDGNPNEPLPDDVKAEFQSQISRTRDMFVDLVARDRKSLSAKKIRETEAQVYYGADAVTAGLADMVGTPEDAMAALRSAIGKSTRSGSRAEAAELIPVAGPAAIEQESAMHAITPGVAPHEATDEPAAISGDTNLSDTDRRVEAPPLKSEAKLATEPALELHTASTPNPKQESSMAQETLDALASKKQQDEDDEKAKKAEAEKKEAKEKEEKEAKAQAKAAKKKADEDMKDCSECEGTGKDEDDDECSECSGTGKVKKMEGKKAMGMSQAKITEVVQLCELAGLKEKAADFLSAGLSLKEVRSQLVDLRSKQSDKATPSGRVGMTSNRSIAAMEEQAKEYARQHSGVSKYQAYARMLDENPELYTQYKNSKSMEFGIAASGSRGYAVEN